MAPTVSRLAVGKVAGGDWVLLCSGANPVSETCHLSRSSSSLGQDSQELSHTLKEFNKNPIILCPLLKYSRIIIFCLFVLLFSLIASITCDTSRKVLSA